MTIKHNYCIFGNTNTQVFLLQCYCIYSSSQNSNKNTKYKGSASNSGLCRQDCSRPPSTKFCRSMQTPLDRFSQVVQQNKADSDLYLPFR